MAHDLGAFFFEDANPVVHRHLPAVDFVLSLFDPRRREEVAKLAVAQEVQPKRFSLWTLGGNSAGAKRGTSALAMVPFLLGEKDKPASEGFRIVGKIDKAGNIREAGGPCGAKPILWT